MLNPHFSPEAVADSRLKRQEALFKTKVSQQNKVDAESSFKEMLNILEPSEQFAMDQYLKYIEGEHDLKKILRIAANKANKSFEEMKQVFDSAINKLREKFKLDQKAFTLKSK